MPKFSNTSKERLETCHLDLQVLFNTVLLSRDCTIVCGYRGKAWQERLFREGKTTLRFPHSKHNQNPSLAVDVVPYVNGRAAWDHRNTYFFAGYVKRVAEELGIHIRLGADWDSDGDTENHSFKDPAHFELA